jgi:hypothetical protein
MQPGLDTVRALFPSQPGPPAWAADVCEVIADLKKLNGATEAGFLAVGGKLIVFLSESRHLHAEIAGLTALVSGDQAQDACNSLLSVRRYVLEMQARSEEIGRAILILRSGAERIRRGFSTFGDIATSFRIAAILARIEVAHLATSQQNLQNLADDVLACSDSIGTRAEAVLEVALDFDSKIASTLREFARIEAIQREELPALLQSVDTDVDAFQIRQRESAAISSNLAAELNAVTKELGSVATSIQFHDITRQQVEHVIEALEGIPCEGSAASISASNAGLASLQKAHIQSAAAAFARSMGQVDSDLQGIAVRVGGMADASKRIQGLQDGHRRGASGIDSMQIQDGMQNQIAAIARAVQELDALAGRSRAIIEGLEGVRSDLAMAVHEVQSIESQLGRISINAVISANHIGAEGEALIAIARAIQELRIQSEERSHEARTALESMGAALHEFTGIDVPASDNAAVTLLADLKTRVIELQLARSSGVKANAMVADLSARLCAEIQAARHQFDIGPLFAEIASRCCATLEAVAGQPQAAETFDSLAMEAKHHERYTMQAERDVHLAVAAPGASLEAQALQPESGEDVEFF